MSATITTTVEVLFDGSTATDISDRVQNVTITYGRQRILDEFGAGTATVTIENRDNFITPGHSDSTYGNTQLIGREVFISAAVTGGSDSHATYLFRGIVQDVDYIPSVDHQNATTVLKLVDGFEKLARAKFENENFAEQLTSARVSAVLDLASINYPNGSNPLDRSIQTGSQTCLADTAVTSGALDYLQKITRTENGRFVVNHAGTPSATNKGGVLTFTAQNSGTGTSGLTISDANTLASGSVQAESLNLEYGSELLFNAYSFTPHTGAVQSGSDATSITKYGRRTVSRETLSDAASTNNAGIYFLNLHTEPMLRISSVTIRIDEATTADAEKLLHLHVTSGIDLNITPAGSSTAIDAEYMVEGVSLNITPRDMATNASTIIATYSTSAADATGYWVLEDPVLGVLPTILAP